jgi:hypothetical protein
MKEENKKEERKAFRGLSTNAREKENRKMVKMEMEKEKKKKEKENGE